MGEMIFLRPLGAQTGHPTLDDVAEAVRTLRRLRERFGAYDEALELQIRAASLRLEEVFGDDDWLAKRFPDDLAPL